jgi:hypothetical protein
MSLALLEGLVKRPAGAWLDENRPSSRNPLNAAPARITASKKFTGKLES